MSALLISRLLQGMRRADYTHQLVGCYPADWPS